MDQDPTEFFVHNLADTRAAQARIATAAQGIDRLAQQTQATLAGFKEPVRSLQAVTQQLSELTAQLSRLAARPPVSPRVGTPLLWLTTGAGIALAATVLLRWWH